MYYKKVLITIALTLVLAGCGHADASSVSTNETVASAKVEQNTATTQGLTLASNPVIDQAFEYITVKFDGEEPFGVVTYDLTEEGKEYFLSNKLRIAIDKAGALSNGDVVKVYVISSNREANYKEYVVRGLDDVFTKALQERTEDEIVGEDSADTKKADDMSSQRSQMSIPVTVTMESEPGNAGQQE